jgi:hypothetical protein
MVKRSFLTPLVVSVAALLGSAPALASVGINDIAGTTAFEKILSKSVVTAGSDLILERNNASNIQTAGHRSHYSHRSHSSHRSHYSSYR